MSSVARLTKFFLERPSTSIGNMMFSKAVRQANRVADWNTTPMSLRVPSMGLPSSSSCPLVFRSRPAKSRNSVLLPHPLGPTTARNWPTGMSMFTSLSATTGFPTRTAYVLATPRQTISGGSGPLRRPAADNASLLSPFTIKQFALPRLTNRGSRTLNVHAKQLPHKRGPLGVRSVCCALMISAAAKSTGRGPSQETGVNNNA